MASEGGRERIGASFTATSMTDTLTFWSGGPEIFTGTEKNLRRRWKSRNIYIKRGSMLEIHFTQSKHVKLSTRIPTCFTVYPHLGPGEARAHWCFDTNVYDRHVMHSSVY